MTDNIGMGNTTNMMQAALLGMQKATQVQERSVLGVLEGMSQLQSGSKIDTSALTGLGQSLDVKA